MNFNVTRQKPKACHTSWSLLPQPLKVAFFVANNRNVGQSGTAVGPGLQPTLNLVPSLSFPQARTE